ncbi:hypothetical protein D3C76_1185020 [compost metagenome]|jgi:hypothetical protein
MCSARSSVAVAWSKWPSAYCCKAVSIRTVRHYCFGPELFVGVGNDRRDAGEDQDLCPTLEVGVVLAGFIKVVDPRHQSVHITDYYIQFSHIKIEKVSVQNNPYQ